MSIDKVGLDEVGLLEGAQTLAGSRSTAAGAALGIVKDHFTIKREGEELEKAGIRLDSARSKAAERKRNRFFNLPFDNLKKFLACGAGSFVGGWLSLLILAPFAAVLPFGTFIVGAIGALAGGYGAGKLYDAAFEKSEHDGVAIAARLKTGGKPITREEALAQLISVLPDNVGDKCSKLLRDKIGTCDCAVALQTPEGTKILGRMLDDPRLEETLRSYIDLPINPHNPGQHIADQYAELVNSGRLPADTIIADPKIIKSVALRYYNEQAVLGNMTAMAQRNTAIPPQPLPASGRVRQQGM